MPTYVYKFTETGEIIEVQQDFADASLTEAVHPATGETMPVKKVFTPVGVTFRGGGFYKTDSRRGSSKSSTNGSAGANGSSTGASTDSAGSSSSESTTAASAPASTPATKAAASAD